MTRRLNVIACPSLQPDLQMLAAEVASRVAFHHLETGLHERPAHDLHVALQTAIDQTTECDAVAVAYGLCSRSVVGIKARDIPVVIPRAHDCIGLMLGSTKRYLGQTRKHPGTYFQSAGWLRAVHGGPQPQFTFGPNSNVTREKLVEKYGEEAADYLLIQFDALTRHYKRLAYIATPADDTHKWEAEARSLAAERNWSFARIEGDTGWMRRLLEGDWQESEFLVIHPGECVVLTSDERLIAAGSA
jgi:hypothetical protein